MVDSETAALASVRVFVRHKAFALDMEYVTVDLRLPQVHVCALLDMDPQTARDLAHKLQTDFALGMALAIRYNFNAIASRHISGKTVNCCAPDPSITHAMGTVPAIPPLCVLALQGTWVQLASWCAPATPWVQCVPIKGPVNCR